MTLLAACGSTRSVESAGRPEPTQAPPAPAIAPPQSERSAAAASEDLLPDPKAVAALPEALTGRGGAGGETKEQTAPEAVAAALPVALWVGGIEIVQAPVVQVGAEPNGEMEIPDAGEVGWYKFGPAPGNEGSAVLAAHVAFDGEDGIFRHLADVSPGSRVVIGYEDGSTADFEIVDLQQYGKAEVPFDRVFARQGEPILTLITCGGAFDTSNRSYADNIVAYAVPL